MTLPQNITSLKKVKTISLVRSENLLVFNYLQLINKTFCQKTRREKAIKEDVSIDERTVNLKEMCSEGVNWIHLAKDRKQWRALVDRVMDL